MKTNYEERKEAKIERLQELADKNENLSSRLWEHSEKMASVIPFGQPILVGHHSESRDRNYRAKIRNTFVKSVEAGEKAQYYKDRAESLLNGTAISSDDPKATDKLAEKLEKLQALQELYKSINKVIKKAKTTEAEKVTLLGNLGISEASAITLMQPDFCGRIGIPSYRLTNNNANISRIKQRIEHIQKIESIESTEEEINGVKFCINSEANRVQMFFTGIPAEETRSKLKHSGFHWSRYEGCWMRQISNAAIWQGKEILNNLQTV